MTNRQQKELQRLEKALLEAEEETFEDAYEDEEDFSQTQVFDYDAYNTDDTDVDMDEYILQVQEDSPGSGLGVVLTMLVMVALSACIFILLKYLGVL